MAGNFSTLFNRLFSLADKTVLITGATGGIGQILAVALAEAGAVVGVHGFTPAKVDETCRLVEEKGGQAVPLKADLTQVKACRRLIDEAHSALGRLDVLVNCAAINRRKLITDVTVDDFEKIMTLNLRTVFFLCQAAYPIMQAQGGGKIINIGSINSTYGLATISVYGAAKAGLAQVTQVMAVEWAKANIQVNCLIPGFFLTPLTEEPLWGDTHRSNWLRERIPARRPGQPEELVGVALLLASPASSYITGTSIVVDGGFLAGGSWEQEEKWWKD
jgi:2-deoxy-D-gluconate 3-dehydrogenase